MLPFRKAAKRTAAELEVPVAEARKLAEKLGLEPYDVNYWIVDHDEMNQLFAYDGFQRRYPHWRWGMKYDRRSKQDQFGMGRAYEMVNNDDPAHAFLQESNDVADQKAVVTHVEAHSDFFANNEWFLKFADGPGRSGSPDAAAMLERHARTIESYMTDPDVDRHEVERWIDHVLCLESAIDQHVAYSHDDGTAEEPGFAEAPEELAETLSELDLSDEVREEVFDEEFLERQADDGEHTTVPAEPEKDLLAFLGTYGKRYDDEAGKAVEMEPWQRDVVEMLRAESYYFAPQRMTKVMNEGWACVAPDTLVFTEQGLVPMADVVADHPSVSDGDTAREVYDSHVIDDHDTVTVETRRGFELTGSNNHRVRKPDGSWIRLEELERGDEIVVTGGNGLWPEERVDVNWTAPENISLEDVADEAGVSIWTVLRYRRTGRARKAGAIETALADYDDEDQSVAQRDGIRVPEQVTETFGRFLGLLVGDGHVSSAAGQVGFTNADREHAEEFAGLADELFGVEPSVERADSRWRVYVYSANLVEFLTDEFDMPDGKAASLKTVPDQIRRSPKSVVAAFLQGLFDADGYAGDQGAILSTSSESLSETVQQLLTNFGVLTRRREQADGCYHVHMTGRSADVFADEIGFGYSEKATALREYLDDLAWFEEESWTDEVVELAEDTGPVYDISVEETHRYAAAGFLNHNSYWESAMMGEEAFAGDDEFVDYADHQSRVLASPGLNPYSLGKELWEYIENTENRRMVADLLLRVAGITWRNFHDEVDFDRVMEILEPTPPLDAITPETVGDLADLPDAKVDHAALDRALTGDLDVERHPWKVLTYEGLAERHFSLVKPQYRRFLHRVSRDELERLSRYMFDDDRYDSVADALADVQYTRGWNRMYEIRESHNDVTFLDEFLSQEFVDANDYFTYEFVHSSGDYRVTSTDYEDVKKKLLLQFTNFGKPQVVVLDGNYRNRNELLLGHQYNGVMLDVEQAKRTLERVFELWGRPVNLLTIVKEVDEHDLEVAKRRNAEPDPTEQGRRIRYDGEAFEEEDVAWEEVEDIAAEDVDYDTKPEDWLA